MALIDGGQHDDLQHEYPRRAHRNAALGVPPPEHGQRTVRVIDDHGRTTQLREEFAAHGRAALRVPFDASTTTTGD